MSLLVLPPARSLVGALPGCIFFSCLRTAVLASMFDSLCRDYLDCTNLHGGNQVVWSKGGIEERRAPHWVPPPLNHAATTGGETVRARARNSIRAVRTWIAQRLRVVHRIHAQLQLRLVGVPARGANQKWVPFSFNNLGLQLRQLIALPAPIAHRDGVFAGGEPIGH